MGFGAAGIRTGSRRVDARWTADLHRTGVPASGIRATGLCTAGIRATALRIPGTRPPGFRVPVERLPGIRRRTGGRQAGPGVIEGGRDGRPRDERRLSGPRLPGAALRGGRPRPGGPGRPCPVGCRRTRLRGAGGGRRPPSGRAAPLHRRGVRRGAPLAPGRNYGSGRRGEGLRGHRLTRDVERRIGHRLRRRDGRGLRERLRRRRERRPLRRGTGRAWRSCGWLTGTGQTERRIPVRPSSSLPGGIDQARRLRQTGRGQDLGSSASRWTRQGFATDRTDSHALVGAQTARVGLNHLPRRTCQHTVRIHVVHTDRRHAVPPP